MKEIYNRLFSTQSKIYLELLVKDFMNTTWAILTGAALYKTQDPIDESQTMCPIEFGYTNKTFDLSASTSTTDRVYAITFQSLVLATVIATPLALCLIKKFRTKNASINSDEKRLAKSAEVMESLDEVHAQTAYDWMEFHSISFMLGPNLACTLILLGESWGLLDQIISFFFGENLSIEEQVKKFQFIYMTLGMAGLVISFMYMFDLSRRRTQAFFDRVSNHATEITWQELQSYKVSPIIMRVKGLSVLILAILLPGLMGSIKHLSRHARTISTAYYAIIFITIQMIKTIAASQNSQVEHERKALVKSHQVAIESVSRLANRIEATRDSHGLLCLQAFNRSLSGFPLHIWFPVMAAFCKREWGYNPLYIDSGEYKIQMIPMETQRVSNTAWQSFFYQIQELMRRKKICKDFTLNGNLFFEEYFHIPNAIKLMPNYKDIGETTFTLQFDLTSMDETQQETIAEIMRKVIVDTEITNLQGILNIDLTGQISHQQFKQIRLQLEKEFKTIPKVKKYSSGNNEFHYFNPSQIYWKPKKLKKQKAFEEKTEEKRTITHLFVPTPIFFGETFGAFDPRDSGCLIKPLPGGPPNTFITMHPALREKLRENKYEEEIEWFTESYDQTIHKPPKIMKAHEEVSADGSIPILKLRFKESSESRATCNQWGQVKQQGKTFTLYIVDEYYDKLHKRTIHAGATAHRIAEKQQRLDFTL